MHSHQASITTTCLECGAPWVDGMSCWSASAQSWRGNGRAGVAGVHFLTVAAYNLQHPAQFTDAALVGLHAAFIDYTDKKASRLPKSAPGCRA